MTQIEQSTAGRTLGTADSVSEHRDVLADAAIVTLSQLGYARTSLRDIAANSPYSHGAVHYYFEDKVELILHGVRRYKARCATHYDEVVSGSTNPEELAAGLADAMVDSLVEEAHLHRLWYDLRSQSYFDEALRGVVVEVDELLEDMIWRVVERYLELLGRKPSVTRVEAYGAFDGLFQHSLLRHLIEPDDNHVALRADIIDLLARLAA